MPVWPSEQSILRVIPTVFVVVLEKEKSTVAVVENRPSMPAVRPIEVPTETSSETDSVTERVEPAGSPAVILTLFPGCATFLEVLI